MKIPQYVSVDDVKKVCKELKAQDALRTHQVSHWSAIIPKGTIC